MSYFPQSQGVTRPSTGTGTGSTQPEGPDNIDQDTIPASSSGLAIPISLTHADSGNEAHNDNRPNNPITGYLSLSRSRSIASSGSPSALRRSGLHQPHPYPQPHQHSSSSYLPSSASHPRFTVPGSLPVVIPHSQDSIRLATMQLSNILFSPPMPASLQAFASSPRTNGNGNGNTSVVSPPHAQTLTPHDSFIFPTPHPHPHPHPHTSNTDARSQTPSLSPSPSPSLGPSLNIEDIDLSASTTTTTSDFTTTDSVSAYAPETTSNPDSNLVSSPNSHSNNDSGTNTPRPPRPLPLNPSGLSLLLSRPTTATATTTATTGASTHDSVSGSGSAANSVYTNTDTNTETDIDGDGDADDGDTASTISGTMKITDHHPSHPPPSLHPLPTPTPIADDVDPYQDPDADVDVDSERTPLLQQRHLGNGNGNGNGNATPAPPPKHTTTKSFLTRLSLSLPPSPSLTRLRNIPFLSSLSLHLPEFAPTAKTAVTSLPAVLLGSLLNILDGVSYGMIIFPAAGVFSNLGPMGVSMFFVTAIISQFIYTFGGSGFAGANGSMMIEVVPFFHILANSIAREIGEDHPREIIATTLVAYAFSSVLTGLCFFLLGALKLGVIIGFFPRHILVGCIGGVGAFLIETGLAVSMRIDDDDFTPTWNTFKFMFLDPHNLILWVLPLALAVILRLITQKYHHQLIFPLYFLIIPLIFYIVVAAAQLNLGDLRAKGWLFDMGSGGEDESWYTFYSYYDVGAIRFGPLWSTLPTQFALLFFNILHPPLNVPALSVSLNEDVDTNKELVAHGYSNVLAGLCGTVPNYLVYVNTLLFYRVGGITRIAGSMLGIANVVLLLIGTGPIAYIPVMVVGALIFVLGIDLVKEALWDTRYRVSRTEYITIISIMVCMTVWDFVIGVVFGIIATCFFFVVQNSQRRSIRALHTGETAMSTVRRPSSQRAYIREVSKQTTILRLQGYLFFGTIAYVEEAIRNIIEGPSWQRNPVRFLVLDLSLVAGVDMSSAEAFVRIQRLLCAKYVTLVFCGFEADTPIGRALQSVDVLGSEGVELFSTFNDALEWTENAYLRAWFRLQKSETIPLVLPGRQDVDIPLSSSLSTSPRWVHLHDVGYRNFAINIPPHLESGDAAEPYNTLVKAFSSYGDVDVDLFRPLVSYLERISVPAGYVVWKQDDPADGLYIIESGVLRASYEFEGSTKNIDESMVPGTLAGELSALSGLPRNATAVVEHAAVIWKLSIDNLRLMETEEPLLARTFVQLVLKAAKIDYDILLAALATRQ